MNRINPTTDVTEVEEELNLIAHNYNIPKEDVQLYAMIDAYNYVPIETYVNSNGRIVIEDVAQAAGLELYIGTKKQFLYKQYIVDHTNLRIDLDFAFKTGWDPKNYVVFRNGYLLNSVLYDIYCPNFGSIYTLKSIYSQTSFLEGDRIDVFYIEGYDKFKPIQFNHDVFIKNVKQFCEITKQQAVRIPYPYAQYPRETEMFYVFNTQTKRYLAKDEDYIVESGRQYIILKDETILTKVNEDSLTFVFPYCMTNYETEINADGVGEESGVSFTMSSYQWEPRHPGDLYSATGILTFDPPFKKYNLVKENFLLFCNNTYVHPERYNLINNNTIQLLDPIDIAHAEFAKFNMLIFEETEQDVVKYRRFEFQVFAVTPTVDGQDEIDVPEVLPDNTNFLVFEGALMFDVSDRYEWDKGNKKIRISDASSIKAGREIVFVFYTNKPGIKKYKTMEIVKIKFRSISDDQVLIENDAGYKIKFNKKNLIVFMNGTYLDPDRYEIDSANIITFTNPLDKLRANKSFTGCYLVSHMLEQDIPYDILDDIREGYPNKLLWFDERKVVPNIEEIVTMP